MMKSIGICLALCLALTANANSMSQAHDKKGVQITTDASGSRRYDKQSKPQTIANQTTTVPTSTTDLPTEETKTSPAAAKAQTALPINRAHPKHNAGLHR